MNSSVFRAEPRLCALESRKNAIRLTSECFNLPFLYCSTSEIVATTPREGQKYKSNYSAAVESRSRYDPRKKGSRILCRNMIMHEQMYRGSIISPTSAIISLAHFDGRRWILIIRGMYNQRKSGGNRFPRAANISLQDIVKPMSIAVA